MSNTNEKKMLRWIRKVARFENGHSGKLGQVTIFETSYNSLRPRGEIGNEWKLYCHLPGFINSRQGSTENELYAIAEKLLRKWLDATNLTFKPEEGGQNG